MLEVPPESLELERVIVSSMSRHTFAFVQPSRHGVENQEIATGVGLKWEGHYLLLTAGHVVDHCPEDTLRFFLPARNIDFASSLQYRPVNVERRELFQIQQPTPPIFADHPIDLAAIALTPQPGAEECFTALDETAIMPVTGTQVGVFGYPAAARIPAGENYIASPEHFFDRLDAAGDGCRHEPQHDFSVPYDLQHPAKGYSGSGVWHWNSNPLWSPEPHLCGILTCECGADKVVTGFGLPTIIKFLKENSDLLRS